MNSKFLSRKFVLSLLTLFLTSGLLWYGRLTPEAYSMIIIGVVGSYIAGNVVEGKQNGTNIRSENKTTRIEND